MVLFLEFGEGYDHNTLVSKHSLEAQFDDCYLIRGLVHLFVTFKPTKLSLNFSRKSAVEWCGLIIAKEMVFRLRSRNSNNHRFTQMLNTSSRHCHQRKGRGDNNNNNLFEFDFFCCWNSIWGARRVCTQQGTKKTKERPKRKRRSHRLPLPLPFPFPFSFLLPLLFTLHSLFSLSLLCSTLLLLWLFFYFIFLLFYFFTLLCLLSFDFKGRREKGKRAHHKNTVSVWGRKKLKYMCFCYSCRKINNEWGRNTSLAFT